MASSTPAASPEVASQNRHTLLKIPKEIILSIHFYASRHPDNEGKPSHLPDVCRDLRWLRPYGRSQSLTINSCRLTNFEDGDSRLRSIAPSGGSRSSGSAQDDQIFFRQDLVYLTVLLDPHDKLIRDWRIMHDGQEIDFDVAHRARGQLAEFNACMEKLLEDATRLRYLSLDIDLACKGMLFSRLINQGPSIAQIQDERSHESLTFKSLSRKLQFEFWLGWKPHCLEHLHVAADDQVTPDIIERCHQGVLKYLHIHHSNDSSSYYIAAKVHGAFITRLSLTLQYWRMTETPLGLPTLEPETWEEIGLDFPNLEWLALFHQNNSHASQGTSPTLSDLLYEQDTDEFAEICEQVTERLCTMPKLKKVALALGDLHTATGHYDEETGATLFEFFQICADSFFKQSSYLQTVGIIDTWPAVHLFDRAMNGAPPENLRIPVWYSTVSADAPKGQLQEFPLSLCSEPWEQTYLHDDEGYPRAFRN